MAEGKKRATGYDKYVNWKIFIVPVVLFFVVIAMPTPYGMKDVGTEVNLGPKVVVNFITRELFQEESKDTAQWRLLTAKIMEQNMRMGALSRDRFLKRDLKWCRKYKIEADPANLVKAKTYVKERLSDEGFYDVTNRALKQRKDDLKYENLSGVDKKNADRGAWHIKVSVAMMVFVVFCFLTECIPLPGVAFAWVSYSFSRGSFPDKRWPCSTGVTPVGLSWEASCLPSPSSRPGSINGSAS